MNEDVPVILFDGVCNLCERSVQFVIENDAKKLFRFAALQSTVGASLLREHRRAHDDMSSMLVIVDGILFRESRAALEIAKRLDAPWPIFYYLFAWVPAFMADAVYRFIGRRRYRWFGKKDECWVPDPELAARFIDQS